MEVLLQFVLLAITGADKQHHHQCTTEQQRQAYGANPAAPYLPWFGESNQHQRGCNEYPNAVAHPPAPPAEQHLRLRNDLVEVQHSGTSACADQAGQRATNQQQHEDAAVIGQGIGEADAAADQPASAQALHGGAQGNAYGNRKMLQAQLVETADRKGEVEQGGAEKHAKQQRITPDQHGCQCDTDWREDGADKAWRYGQQHRQAPGQQVGQGQQANPDQHWQARHGE